MADNDSLVKAKKTKDDEHYTLYEDIEREMNAYFEFNSDVFRDKTILLPCDDPEWSNFTKYFVANFNRFGLKKLISTSYANESKKAKLEWQPTLFELSDEQYDEFLSPKRGKIFTLTRRNRNVNKDDLKWKYLENDGDFNSDEVKALRDEADIIITNPPFSLFNEFVSWIMNADKRFIIIGNFNDATNLNIFPLIMKNKMWLGTSNPKRFLQPDGTYKEFGNTVWYTNVDHGLRHEKLSFMTRADNLKFNARLIKKFKEDYKVEDYPKYDNYDALEVPFIDAIPVDYEGIMGLPASFLNHYNPEQFEIVGTVSAPGNEGSLNLGKDYSKYIGYKQDGTKTGRTGSTFGRNAVLVKDDGKKPYYEKDGMRVQSTFPRVFIKFKEGGRL